MEVGGLVNKPGTYDLNALNRFDQEERVARLRCVEGWSMVIPWNGFPHIWLVKPGVLVPYYWLTGICALLLQRLPLARQWITRLRR
jgi:hypothetical protein